MKVIFSLFLFSYISSLSELAEKKKKMIYLKKIVQTGMENSPVFIGNDHSGKMVLQVNREIQQSSEAFLIKSNYLFTNSKK